MFNIGDKVVYPMQGAGIIESIQEKEMLGEKQQYYIIKILISKMEIMIPFNRIQSSNLRPINDEATLESTLQFFSNEATDSQEIIPAKQRYQINMDKIKSGSLKQGAEVIRDLTRMNSIKTLNSSEKQMLMNAKRFLISEMILIKGFTEEQADDLLNACFN
ncbi:CarD family transcriptional regulator [Desnuesiella massiliensis]|uniref:CarD family transcriptional regulator n=1 Tax=Desnuesiella massiliensis TaxID=1650662 RepID=UPI00093A5EAF|nr:CarD family transcriptional regulator [Desnuesiella massiliensis]